MDTLQILGEIGLGSRLKRLSESLMKEIQLIYDDQNIDFDPYLFPAFYKIASCDQITNTVLRESLQTSQPSVTQTINKLLKKQLVVLTEDVHDKRKKQITLSEKGRKMLLHLRPLWKIMDETVKEYSTTPANSLVEHISMFEESIYSGKFTKSIKAKTQNLSNVQIVAYKEEYASYFYDYNIAWLEKYFYVEPFDREVLSKPKQYILNPGGHIFFAIDGNKVMGTVALLIRDDNVFELTKMAVSPEFQGKRVGQLLLQHCIDFARTHKFKGLYLYSNRILENAIHIYRKYGFEEVEIEPNSPYERSNIKMVYPL